MKPKTNNDWIIEFKQNAIYRLDESSRMNRISFSKLKEEDFWKAPNNQLNSVGNLVLHLCGNMRQYILSSLAEAPDVRQRDLEFSTQGGYTSKELAAMLFETVESVKQVIEEVSEEKLLKKRMVQGFEFSGIGIVMHVVEHYSYHTGQIAFWVKLLKETNLNFYDGMDLSVKNEE